MKESYDLFNLINSNTVHEKENFNVMNSTIDDSQLQKSPPDGRSHDPDPMFLM